MKDLFVNGVLVGQAATTGDTQLDAETAPHFLKAKELHREVNLVQGMCRQADSFDETAALLNDAAHRIRGDETQKPEDDYLLFGF